MAYRIKKKKVNRKYMFTVIKVQQEKLNELFADLNKLKNQKLYYEQRVQELMKSPPIASLYNESVTGGTQ